MIRVEIHDTMSDGESQQTTSYGVSVEVDYSPDVLDDVCRRMVALRHADIAVFEDEDE